MMLNFCFYLSQTGEFDYVQQLSNEYRLDQHENDVSLQINK